MKQNTLMIATLFGVSSLALLGAGCASSDSSNDAMMKDGAMMQGDSMMQEDAMMRSDDSIMMEGGEMKMEKDVMMMEGGDRMETMEKKDGESMMEKEGAMEMQDAMMMKAGTYQAYNASKLAMANTGDVVLFFHASWCPTCKAANDDIMARAANIPSDLTILKVDYDSATDLRKTYGVTMQHTFVQVDSTGKMIKKWTGGNTLDAITKQVQ